METILLMCGFYNIGFALFHFGFWKIFNWKVELKKLSYPNKAIMQILNIQICYYFLFTAIICFAFPSELFTTKFGNWFLIGTSLFWLIRTLQQLIFLRANHYKIHLLTFIFLIGTVLFALPIFFK
jgi:hypothetical protein